MPIGWTGDLTRLVPLDKARHLENILAWVNDPDITHNIFSGDFPMSREAEQKWFDAMAEFSNQPTDIVLAIETLAGEHIGMAGLHKIEWKSGVAMTGTTIGRREYWGKGFASDAVRTRTRYAFEVLNLRLLLSEVYPENVGSLRVLTKNGYKECGRIPRRTWKRGSYRDVIMLYCDRDEWAAAHGSTKP